MNTFHPFRAFRIGLLCLTSALFSWGAVAQIGGQTAADGPFLLEDAEDLDFVAIGVMRNWVSDWVWPSGYVLDVTSLEGTGLVLAQGQSPQGALKAEISQSLGYISGGFGVPMPAVDGESTLDFPGDITSFSELVFLARFSPAGNAQRFQVTLETYPGPDFPKLHYVFAPAEGTTFEEVRINLWSPDLIEYSQGLTLQELLSQTRFLYFYLYAEDVRFPTSMEAHFDDIYLLGPMGSETPTPTPAISPTSTPDQTPIQTPTVPSESGGMLLTY